MRRGPEYDGTGRGTDYRPRCESMAPYLRATLARQCRPCWTRGTSSARKIAARRSGASRSYARRLRSCSTVERSAMGRPGAVTGQSAVSGHGSTAGTMIGNSSHSLIRSLNGGVIAGDISRAKRIADERHVLRRRTRLAPRFRHHPPLRNSCRGVTTRTTRLPYPDSPHYAPPRSHNAGRPIARSASTAHAPLLSGLVDI